MVQESGYILLSLLFDVFRAYQYSLTNSWLLMFQDIAILAQPFVVLLTMPLMRYMPTTSDFDF